MDKIRILLIDDDVDDAELISFVLTRKIKNISVKYINSFELFKEIIRAANYDLIITEYRFGDFTGLDIITELHAKEIEIPVILITEEHGMEKALAAIRLHADDYVLKNFKYMKRLPSIISRVLKNSHIESIKKSHDVTISHSLDNYIDLFESSSELMFSLWQDGTFLNVNKSALETFGYTRREIDKLNIKDILDKEWFIEFDEIQKDISKRSSRLSNVELTFHSRLGKKIHVTGEVNPRIENGKNIGSHWILKDVTESKKTDDILIEKNEQYMCAFEYAPYPMVMGDHRGVVLQINQAACDLVGYTYEEMIGKHIRSLTHPMDLLKSLKEHRKLMSGSQEHYKINKRYRHKKGHYIDVEVSAALVRNKNGQPRFAIAEIKELDNSIYI